MELILQPRAQACQVSGQPFADGDRVASFLVRGADGAVARCDVLAAQAAEFSPSGFVVCRWVQVFKPMAKGEDSGRQLKLTAENLFLTLADPATELAPENTRLVQFLALLLERKRILRPKGRTADGERQRFEHARTKQLYEVPAGELTPEFFAAIQEQLGTLVGVPKPKEDVTTAEPPAGV
ncbi:MAG: hypothetical protein ABSE59_09740 [Opitutaceae bacterium]|jgi:hypothetical protein